MTLKEPGLQHQVCAALFGKIMNNGKKSEFIPLFRKVMRKIRKGFRQRGVLAQVEIMPCNDHGPSEPGVCNDFFKPPAKTFRR
ncbi:MAG TPA: hypothetical protein VKF42_04410, partial [Chitinivibrionales bacterium]|nr:hypothetical protein [Chitinivibrionales bacterium]